MKQSNLGRVFKGFIKHSSPTILSFLAIGGLVGTVVFAIRAKGKADEKIKEIEEAEEEEMTTARKVRVSIPYYIPTFALGLGTAACILGANVISKKQSAALSSAYALLERTVRHYRQKLGNETIIFDRELAAEDLKKDPPVKEDYEEELPLFYEPITRTKFNASEEFMKDALINLNKRMAYRHFTSVAELADDLDIEPKPEDEYMCNILGWDESDLIKNWKTRWVNMAWEKFEMDDGLEVNIISYDPPPLPDETLYPQCRDFIGEMILN